jgi:O-antigen/teichoic acid export membrane protein
VRIDGLRRLFSTVTINVLIAIAAACTSVMIARVFGPEIRGQYAVITALANTVVTIAALGTQTYLARVVAEQEKVKVNGLNRLNPRRALLGVLCLSTLLSFALAIGLNWNSRILHVNGIIVFALGIYLPLSLLSMQLLNLSLGQANWRSFNAGRLLFAVATLLFVLIYGLSGGTELTGVVVCLVASNVLTVVLQIWLAHPMLGTSAGWLTSIGRVYRKSWKYAFNSFANLSTGYADVLVSSILFQPAAVGYWAVARTVSALLSPMNSAISVTVFSTFARGEAGDGSSFKEMVRNFLLFNIVLVAVLYLASELIIIVVFGSDFTDSVPLVPLALSATVAGGLSEMFEERLRGGGRPGPVNISRLVPLIALFAILIFADHVTSIWQLALFFSLAQAVRAVIAMLLVAIVRLEHIEGETVGQDGP